MKVREYRGEDAEKVAAMHEAMGLDYTMIDLGSPLVVVKTIVEQDGEIIAAGALKLQAEAYLWVKPGARPAAKWDAIRLMQREVMQQALRMGIEQVVAYVPQCVGRFFARRMNLLRWSQPRDGWAPWVYEVKP